VRQTATVLLTISTTSSPATDLGYLLHKHPGKAQSFGVSVGQAHVFYPEVSAQRCTAALLLEVDAIALVRGHKRTAAEGFSLAQYVNDRPYAASSMLAVALARVFKSAMAGRCDARPERAKHPLPLELHLPVVPCRGGPQEATSLFEPLGWTVAATAIALDPQLPAWGDSRYVDLRLTGDMRLADALGHLYVMLPVLDGSKHYWVSTDEVDKLLRTAEGWLSGHPARDLILRRYLANQRSLVQSAVSRLAEVDDTLPERLDNAVAVDDDADAADASAPPARLADARRDAVVAALRSARAARVVDLGCGSGALLKALIADPSFTEVVGVDVSHRALEAAAGRLRFDRMSDSQRARVQLIQSSLTYRDDRLAGYDAVVLMEVIEHVDPPRLPALARTLFSYARPLTVVVTTPNVEYNVRYDGLPAGSMRHRDHRFEWTRAQFRGWSDAVAAAHGYAVRYLPVGDDDPVVGPSTQMAVFSRASDLDRT
jgi:3' terminal RNA ribose 2'-O-methyltransferase Hen1